MTENTGTASVTADKTALEGSTAGSSRDHAYRRFEPDEVFYNVSEAEALQLRQSALALVDSIERVFMPDKPRTKEMRDYYLSQVDRRR